MSSATVEEAKKALDEDAKNRSEECSKEVRAALDKYKCRFDVGAILRQSGTEFFMSIVTE